MKLKITLVTLGVDDLQKSLDFYRALGLTGEIQGGEDAEGGVVFFELAGGMRLALWERKSIEKDTGLQGPKSPTEFTLAHNCTSEAEVDELMAQAERAGATIVKPAQKVFWGGYSGYFQDPDGHIWEVAFNPFWKLAY
ncbi:MAG TPA: VOC family protein [Candidatus Paceibacterota bacterium]|nr:VOC family protein [Candidatus Paceibacterota bacterium]